MGYVLKQTATNDLVEAIRTIGRGGRFFSATIARRLQNRFPQGLEPGRRPKETRSLTSRESEVLQLIADGFSNKEIGAELGISVKTVEKHRQQVMNKLGIHETAGLTRYAMGLSLDLAKSPTPDS
jgi:DNA-binding NarL/FixJ family response regulator